MTIAPYEYEKAAFIAHEACEQMLERLTLMKLQPHTIIDTPCRDGYHIDKLTTQYPNSIIIGLDPAVEFLQHCQQKNLINLTSQQNHLPASSAELIFSNLGLIKYFDIESIAKEWRRVLKPGGIVMLSCLGPDTLQELSGEKTLALHDMHNIGDALIKAGFMHPVLDVEHITVTYQDVNILFQELQQADLIQSANQHPPPEKNSNGQFSLTFEIVYGHAFVPEVSDEFKADDQGIVRIPIDRLRRSR